MDTQGNLLVITAHIGDGFTRSGGTIAKYLAAGHRARILSLTWGQYSESQTRWKEDPSRTVEEVIAIRRQEGEEAAGILGVELKCLGWEDGHLSLSDERIHAIRREIGEFQPNIILTHMPTDHIHPDHVTTSNGVRLASKYVGARPGSGPKLGHGVAIYYFEATAPVPTYADFRPTIYVDVSEVFEKKMAAVKVINRTQPTVYDYYTSLGRMRGQEATLWARGRRGQVAYAEGFVQDMPFTTDLLPW